MEKTTRYVRGVCYVKLFVLRIVYLWKQVVMGLSIRRLIYPSV